MDLQRIALSVSIQALFLSEQELTSSKHPEAFLEFQNLCLLNFKILKKQNIFALFAEFVLKVL